MTTPAHIAEYLAEQTPDHEGDVCVAFTREQRDQLVVALRTREAVEPFLQFARRAIFRQLPDTMVLTMGSPFAHQQLRVSDFRALLEAVGDGK
jgi:hypothetical protein